MVACVAAALGPRVLVALARVGTASRRIPFVSQTARGDRRVSREEVIEGPGGVLAGFERRDHRPMPFYNLFGAAKFFSRQEQRGEMTLLSAPSALVVAQRKTAGRHNDQG